MTDHVRVAKGEAMHDILRHIHVHVACDACGAAFDVPASTVAESQRLLAHGCPGSSFECPPAFYAALIDPAALDELARAWRHVQASSRIYGDGSEVIGQARVARHLVALDDPAPDH